MILKEKEGQKFWGCKNWRECGGKTIPYGQKGFQKATSGNDEVMNGLRKIYAKLETIQGAVENVLTQEEFFRIFTDKNAED